MSFNDYEYIAKKWAIKLTLNLKNKIDSGSNGTAYLTSNNTVIKITKDLSEFVNAYLTKDNNESTVRIFDLIRLEDDLFGIHQELLDTSIKDEIVALYDYVEEELEIHFDSIINSTFNNISFLSDRNLFIIEEIRKCYKDLCKTGACTDDIWGGNIGLNKNTGKITLFDLGYDEMKEDKDFFKKVKYVLNIKKIEKIL